MSRSMNAGPYLYTLDSVAWNAPQRICGDGGVNSYFLSWILPNRRSIQWYWPKWQVRIWTRLNSKKGNIGHNGNALGSLSAMWPRTDHISVHVDTAPCACCDVRFQIPKRHRRNKQPNCIIVMRWILWWPESHVDLIPKNLGWIKANDGPRGPGMEAASHKT